MKINNSNKDRDESVDVSQLISDLQDKYRDIFIVSIQGEIFIYKPLGRRDWCDICNRNDLNALQKEDLICATCVVYPENYDFSQCAAGLPTELASKIKQDSYLSKEAVINMIEYYRDDMATINNNITCIINEAFPNFDIEEIENWGWDRTIKYFTRAEWKLTNLRGLNSVEDIIDLFNKVDEQNNETHTVETSQITGLTKEELAEKQAKFPEIDWANPSRS